VAVQAVVVAAPKDSSGPSVAKDATVICAYTAGGQACDFCVPLSCIAFASHRIALHVHYIDGATDEVQQ
jgi:hypothetical protein